MEFIEVLRNRKTTNGYFKEDPVSIEHQHLLMEAASRAPSHMNSQPWRFVLVDDKEIIAHIADIAGRTMQKTMESSFFKANRKYFRFSKKEVEEKGDGLYFAHLPPVIKQGVKFLFEKDVLKRLKNFGVTKMLGMDNRDIVSKSPLLLAVLIKEHEYDTDDERLTFYYTFAYNVAIGMAIENIWLTATDIGMGCQFVSTPKQYPEAWDEIRNTLNIPAGLKLMALLRLGYVREKPKFTSIYWKSDVRKSLDKFVHRNQFGNPEKV